MKWTASAVLAAAVLMLAACSSSAGGNGGDNPVVTPPQPSSSSSSTSSPPPPSPSSHQAVSSPSVRPSSSPTSSSSASPPPRGPFACTAEQLTITLLRGGAIQHQQLAALVFTNSSPATCTLRGYPTAQLVVNGNVVGSPARQQAGATPTVSLAHGASAQATLTATTDCQAPLSDHVRVSAPGQTHSVDLVDTLRDCTVTVSAVAPSS